jgi:hypothetical protein
MHGGHVVGFHQIRTLDSTFQFGHGRTELFPKLPLAERLLLLFILFVLLTIGGVYLRRRGSCILLVIGYDGSRSTFLKAAHGFQGVIPGGTVVGKLRWRFGNVLDFHVLRFFRSGTGSGSGSGLLSLPLFFPLFLLSLSLSAIAFGGGQSHGPRCCVAEFV